MSNKVNTARMEGENNDQQQKIQDEKRALRNQLITLTVLSFVVSGLFYGVTLLQNPYDKA